MFACELYSLPLFAFVGLQVNHKANRLFFKTQHTPLITMTIAQLCSTYISPVSLFHALWLVDGFLLMPLPATRVLHSLLVVFNQPI